MSDKDFEKLVKACEIYTFRVHAVLARRKDKNSGKIISLSNGILKNAKDITFVLRTLCSWLSDMAPMREVIAKLANGEPKYFYAPGIAGWAYCYYFLYEYEVYISPVGVSPLPWGVNKEDKKDTQEHVLPQQHRDNGWWEAEWPDEAKADKYKHRLGNLVLTMGNSHLGRKPINKKINDPNSIYFYDHRNATNSEKLIKNYTNGTEWKEKNILKRELDLLEFTTSRWSIPCTCDNGNIYLPDAFSELEKNFIHVQEPESYQSFDDDANNDILDDILSDYDE